MDCDSSDRAALLKIKEQLGNPVELSSWLPATNCCSWDSGIICSEAGRVYLVALFSLNVTVPIPTALGDLPLLHTIQLEAMPAMYGPIPSTFAKLSHLEFLFITGTSISGSIPDFLVKTNLSALSITNSKLTGQIPQSLSRLPNLRVVDLSGNMLTGSIPSGLLHGSFRLLILSNNQLTGEIPEEYGNGDVHTVDLSHNQLTGNPSFLFDISEPMAKIDLSWNEFEFDMTKIRFPHHLGYLDLSHNNIKGRVAKSLKDINLRFFNVSYNELCGEIPTGRYTAYHGADCYIHNKCLCGSPLPPCKNGQ
ncbi:hypothetical protein E2562_001697 [Oryza meyeriana var. granulata]|uniref:Leucine-rich repeat-containing N-terminal plant-type domain-containing protein n=1 Tax=Oryza meyeriana var. granulata TaxID=110450 RepID=A0A6G1CCZ3_9ORYZ|nr:hypothetical protein E2562_001697 [Oryza meyeriana var. granulata]